MPSTQSNKEITESYNVSYTDITTISREALNDASLLATDGLHPSGNNVPQMGRIARILKLRQH